MQTESGVGAIVIKTQAPSPIRGSTNDDTRPIVDLPDDTVITK